ncbi:gliding motility-associated C-terminal domain-containing protein [Segetibacter sp. 3557_3]|uniref:T9SS type B sorting domain-containing protein n=1 Tax=Segetibacter sp. 3557_3 TaxID=2547429 RepID=UPI0010586192|nr:gliding motility-associated C-terminal domain-containing protein [Segetibacter sp. 3557_3]TDH26863.1 gliding motility-associated C-terminal domain-containing protein [Segetibacter sp. 3557_3]
MRHLVLLIFLVTYFSLAGNGQKRNNVWVFGQQSGLDFNKSPVAPLDATAADGVNSNCLSSICDSSGKLLFYSDGKEVWTSTHVKMVKQGVQWPWGGFTVPLVCPYPGNDSLYYLFAVAENLHMLRYLTINTKLNNGLGGIVYPPPPIPFNYTTTLLNDASVMVAGTTHCNKRDKWIIAHSGADLYAYLVTDAGVSTAPVTSSVLSVLNGGTFQGGNFKFAANGEKLIMPLLSENRILVFDFNALTGRFSNPISIHTPPEMTLEEVELSPDGSKLYLGTYFIRPNNNPFNFKSHVVLQMNLDAGSVTDIYNSVVELSPYPDESGCTPRTCFTVERSLQLAPDGRIYVSFRTNEPFAHIIQEPNIAGFSAHYGLYGVKFASEYGKFNYNYIRSESFEPRINGITVKRKNCATEPTTLSLIYKNVDSVRWNFGDPSSGTKNFSNRLSDDHLYPGPGSYQVRAIIYRSCSIDTAATTVVISSDKPVKIPAWIRDTTLCLGSENPFDATTPFATTYFWSDGITRGPVYRIKEKGVYSITASNECSRDVRRFAVNFDTCDCSVYFPDAFTPNSDGLNDVFKALTNCSLQNFELKIYSRLGHVVFSTTDRTRGWDGSIGAKPAEAGTYVFQVRYRDPNNRKYIAKSGTIVLIR